MIKTIIKLLWLEQEEMEMLWESDWEIIVNFNSCDILEKMVLQTNLLTKVYRSYKMNLSFSHWASRLSCKGCKGNFVVNFGSCAAGKIEGKHYKFGGKMCWS